MQLLSTVASTRYRLAMGRLLCYWQHQCGSEAGAMVLKPDRAAEVGYLARHNGESKP